MKPERDTSHIFTVLHAVQGMSDAEIAREAKRRFRRDITPSTIRSLRIPVSQGGTKFPQRYTLETIGLVGGLKNVWLTNEQFDALRPAGTRRPIIGVIHEQRTIGA